MRFALPTRPSPSGRFRRSRHQDCGAGPAGPQSRGGDGPGRASQGSVAADAVPMSVPRPSGLGALVHRVARGRLGTQRREYGRGAVTFVGAASSRNALVHAYTSSPIMHRRPETAPDCDGIIARKLLSRGSGHARDREHDQDFTASITPAEHRKFPRQEPSCSMAIAALRNAVPILPSSIGGAGW